MNYLIAYLAVGVLALMGIGIDAHMRRRASSSDWSQVSDLVRRANQQWPEVVLERLIVPAIAGVAIIIAWPLAVAFAMHFYRRTNKDEARAISLEPAEFTVKPSDLIERLTIETIEVMQIVHDPLLAAPQIPFGHLNRAWLDFRSQIQPADEVWSFRVRWGNFQRPKAVRQGYAALRNGVISTVCITKISPCYDPTK